jgi:predicted RNA-binding Zn ribbon-like protein
MIEDPLAARIAFVEIMGASQRLEERRLEFREGLVRLVETEGSAAVVRGEITPRDFRFAALALTGAANAIIYDWARTPDGEGVEELEDALAELAVTLLAD